jgi:hypothetical protein
MKRLVDVLKTVEELQSEKEESNNEEFKKAIPDNMIKVLMKLGEKNGYLKTIQDIFDEDILNENELVLLRDTDFFLYLKEEAKNKNLIKQNKEKNNLINLDS